MAIRVDGKKMTPTQVAKNAMVNWVARLTEEDIRTNVDLDFKGKPSYENDYLGEELVTRKEYDEIHKAMNKQVTRVLKIYGHRLSTPLEREEAHEARMNKKNGGE